MYRIYIYIYIYTCHPNRTVGSTLDSSFNESISIRQEEEEEDDSDDNENNNDGSR
jgi:hypothetical protein